MKQTLLSLFALFSSSMFAQGYTSYFTGNAQQVSPTPTFGVCLMGGAGENDEAMKWLLQRANGGDVVVLRSSGSDGYNDYFYSQLGVAVNSVETLVITSAAGAVHPYVLDKVANAELIWIAGGNQWNYVQFFKGNVLGDLLNEHINVKQAPIGGTSAGMAILGSHYYTAQNGSVTSAQALSNPFHNNVTIGANDFINIPVLQNVITDTHYDNPDRRGRHATFMARMANDYSIRPLGIASEEYVAVCIDENNHAHVYGQYPQYQDFAFFVQPLCGEDFMSETVQPGTPLTWNRGQQALKVYRVPGTMNGENYLDLNDWQTASGGTWLNWWIVNGTLNSGASVAPECTLSIDRVGLNWEFEPNPFNEYIRLKTQEPIRYQLHDVQGKIVLQGTVEGEALIDTRNLQNGAYFLRCDNQHKNTVFKLIKN